MTVINSQLLHTADGGRSEGDNETNSILLNKNRIYISPYTNQADKNRRLEGKSNFLKNTVIL